MCKEYGHKIIKCELFSKNNKANDHRLSYTLKSYKQKTKLTPSKPNNEPKRNTHNKIRKPTKVWKRKKKE